MLIAIHAVYPGTGAPVRVGSLVLLPLNKTERFAEMRFKKFTVDLIKIIKTGGGL